MQQSGKFKFEARYVCMNPGYNEVNKQMILDNAKIHHAKLLQDFLDKNNDRLELMFLPPYSPNLNKIEELWGWLGLV